MKILIGCFGYPGYFVPHLAAVAGLLNALGDFAAKGTVTFHLPGALRDQGHSQIASGFVADGDADVLLIADGDVVFDPRGAVQICQQALTHHVVGGLEGPNQDRCWSAPGVIRQPTTESGDLVSVHSLGAGLLAISRTVLERLAADLDLPDCGKGLRPFFAPIVTGSPSLNRYLGDSHAFCERVRNAGLSLYLNPTVRAERIGRTPVDMLIGRTA
jgi:hypothetical protein